eukprot:COSAG05_NODE_74_length_21769_cov_194.316290_28_plen_133_part_00
MPEPPPPAHGLGSPTVWKKVRVGNTSAGTRPRQGGALRQQQRQHVAAGAGTVAAARGAAAARRGGHAPRINYGPRPLVCSARAARACAAAARVGGGARPRMAGLSIEWLLTETDRIIVGLATGLGCTHNSDL